jgi:uncharacterized protein YfdQ (DUF2303 family)
VTGQSAETVALIERAIRLGAQLTEAKQKPDGSGFVVVAPQDMRVHEFANPEFLGNHVKQQLSIEHPDDFIAYLLTHRDKAGQTVVFADQGNLRLIGVLNYHRPDAPSYADHRAIFPMQFDPTYAAWRQCNGNWMEQVEFARFLEEHAQDVISPAAATIIEIASSLEVKTEVDFKKAINLQNGAVQLQFVERNAERTSGNFEVPKQLVIETPIYFGGELVQIFMFFRYSAKGGTLKFKLDLHRWQYNERDAFLNISSRIGKECAVPVYLGRMN